QLQKYIADYPQMEEGWSRNWGHRMVRWSRRMNRRLEGVARQQLEAELAEEIRSLCRGVEILREGISPFPPEAKVLDSPLLAWNDATIPKLAQAIRDEEAFERMPILADALEDAGCANEQILGHLRT